MKHRKIRCKHCGDYFYPDSYNCHRQKYCSLVECRKASSKASSKAYRKKLSKIPAYRQSESERVKEWQRKNPDYWKIREKSCRKNGKSEVLRDFAQVEKLQSEITVLRDFANSQYLILEGLIVNLTGEVLRDDIGAYVRRLYDKGREISGVESGNDLTLQFIKERSSDVKKAANRLSPQTHDPPAVQLGGSQSCKKRLHP